MVQTTARVKKGAKHFEVLVDLDEALKVRKGEGNINAAVLTDAVFHNLKSGEHAGVGEMEDAFGSSDLMVVAESNLPRFKRSRALYKLFRPYPFGMDLVVYTPEEIERGKKSPISFVSRVLREGKTVYVRGN